MEKVTGFTEADARSLLRLTGGAESPRPSQEQRYPLSQSAIAYTGVSGVPARSGSTAGSATVTLYKLVGATLTSTSVTVTAYNLSTTAVAGSAYIQVKREYLTGKWLVDFEDCP